MHTIKWYQYTNPKLTYTSPNTFTYKRASELTAFANIHFKQAYHWISLDEEKEVNVWNDDLKKNDLQQEELIY